MRDMGMTDEEASAEMRAMAALLESPVPTATARGLMGEAPFTPTATRTPVPTDTREPTATSTPRPRPTATETEKPTKKPKTATPTPAGSLDVTNPTICCMALSPAIGSTLASCTFNVDDLEVWDPAFSAGIATGDVYAKYNGPTTPGWVTTNLSLVSGGFVSGPGSDWSAHYAGAVTMHNVSNGQTIDVAGLVTDLAFKSDHKTVGTYLMATDCP
jgi:hypothetical protein